jgi:hypothetical protein
LFFKKRISFHGDRSYPHCLRRYILCDTLWSLGHSHQAQLQYIFTTLCWLRTFFFFCAENILLFCAEIVGIGTKNVEKLSWVHLCVKQQLQLRTESGLSWVAIYRVWSGVEWSEEARKQTDLQKYSFSFDVEGFCAHPGTSLKMVICSLGLLDLTLLDFYLCGSRKTRCTSKKCRTWDALIFCNVGAAVHVKDNLSELLWATQLI